MLYIDASRYNNTKNRTGVENYSYFLINELIESYSDITLISPRKIALPAKQLVIPFPRLWTQLRLSLEVLMNRKIKRLLIPSHLMPIIHPEKTAIVIHDVAFRRYPESYSTLSRWYLNWGAKFAVKHAYQIIVPSQITKNDLVEFYGANPNKIKVIPLGFSQPSIINHQSSAETLQKYGLQKQKYFIFVGRIETKKNIKTLLKAFSRISDAYPDYKLVLAGKPGVGYEEMMSGIDDQKSEVVITGYISDEEKWALMQGALCFIFPSLFEGFGIPLLEAMSVHLPIIASDIPSSREVMANEALFFDTLNFNELANHMESIIHDKNLIKTLTENYENRLSQFSWEKCAEEVLRVLSS